MSADPTAPLSFADASKLELDQLIDELVDRAQGVKRVQGRLRALLRAVELVTGDLALERVLQHIAEAACTLADAHYAALGVIGHDGSLEQFIHVGIDHETAQRIGPLPQGKGLLGALITDPRPIRLTRIADDERSVGFPPGHPPMSSFLGVPIRVRGEVFGNLYLTESRHGAFSAEDEELVASLALAAGTAVSNARLYHDSRLQQRWLAASLDISAQIMASVGEDPLRTIARYIADIASADLVSVGLVDARRSDILVEVAVGVRGDELVGRRFALAGSLAGRAIEENAPLLLRDPREDEGRTAVLAGHVDAGPIMVLPMRGNARVLGVLTVVRRSGSAPFTPADLEMAAAFTSQAAVALELASARADQQRVALLEDRDRIARDLHDHVIQQLFAIGLSLQGFAAMLGDDHQIAVLLQNKVQDIDRTIRQIRTSIFALRGPIAGPADGLRNAVLGVVSDVTPALGFSPHVAFTGRVDSGVPQALADDVIACVREGLTNAAKHAGARQISVNVQADDTDVVVRISDDGSGIPESARHSGLANLRARATARGGSFTTDTPPEGGTTLTWKVPIP